MRETVHKEAKNATKRNNEVRGMNSVRSSHPVADRVAVLQNTIGNGAVERLFRAGMLQAKLRLGRPNDLYEQEADRVADQVIHTPGTAVIGRHSAISRGNNGMQMKPG